MDFYIEFRNVSKTYGPVRALVNVSARFASGRVTVVSGANGSGKSTMLSILATLSQPTVGEVDHGALGKTPADVRRNLGWLGHESLCYADLTGRENIVFAAKLYGCDAERAFEKASERFQLSHFADRPMRTYSRGQRQRIALARSLVHAPRLLLLDEPTTGLDDASAERLGAVVREEARAGNAVVVVTHDAAFAKLVGDDAIVMDRGRRVSSTPAPERLSPT